MGTCGTNTKASEKLQAVKVGAIHGRKPPSMFSLAMLYIIMTINFRTMLYMTITCPPPPPPQDGYSIFDVNSVEDMATTDIVLESHCYGCTAGKGSSCQGATV